MDELTGLLLAAQSGDEVSLTAFVRKSQPEVWRFCAHLVGVVHADDATQETYVGAWRALPAFRGESSARTWLLAIARRSARRVGIREQRHLALGQVATPPARPPDPAHWTEIDLQIAQLDDDRRLALLLTQVLGLSYEESAQVCRCAVGTIRSRVARARGDLIALRRTDDPLPEERDVVERGIVGIR